MSAHFPSALPQPPCALPSDRAPRMSDAELAEHHVDLALLADDDAMDAADAEHATVADEIVPPAMPQSAPAWFVYAGETAGETRPMRGDAMSAKLVTGAEAQAIADHDVPLACDEGGCRVSATGTCLRCWLAFCDAHRAHTDCDEEPCGGRVVALPHALARTVIAQEQALATIGAEVAKLTTERSVALCAVGELNADVERLRAWLDEERAEAKALRANLAGRTVPPTDEEITWHWRMGGTWLVQGATVLRGVEEIQRYRDQSSWAAIVWLPIRNCRPCAWPVPS